MSITSLGKKLAVMMVAAFAACLLSASVAFASPYVDVTFDSLQVSDDQGGTTPFATSIDLATVTNTSTAPVLGQYYKGGWTVLATGYNAGDYATVEAVLQAALDEYTDEHGGSYTLAGLLSTTNAVKMYASGSAYGKYTLSKDDVLHTSNHYFFNGLTSSASAFPTGSGYSTPWTLVRTDTDTSGAQTTTSLSVVNPVSYGAVIAMNYGKASQTAGESCADLAEYAYNHEGNETDKAPRVIISGVEGGSVAGARFCSNLSGLEVL